MRNVLHRKMKHLFTLAFFFSAIAGALAQGFSVTGKVVDEKAEGVPGATVVVKGTTVGTATNVDGNFTLNVPDGSETLVVSFIGYKTQEVPINNRAVVDISLAVEAKALEEVVVIGYGTMKKSDVTGAVASVGTKKLNTLPAANAVESLQGKIAGVNIGAVTSPGEAPAIRIRGNRSLNASNEPLYVVDGIPRNTIVDIPVTDIESVEVLKDAASTAIYGSRGANGVILVTTRRAKANQPT